jgi:superfamily II DNA or RNA helicase
MSEDAPSYYPRFERGLLLASTMPPDAERWWKHDHRTGLWATPAINNSRVREPLPETQTQWKTITFPRNDLKDLRPDQERACEAWKENRRGVIVMATGTGKTEIAFHLVREIASHTLFVAPTRVLAYQLAARIESAFGVDVGFIGDHTFRLRPICVTTYQSAGIKMEHLGAYFKLLIFDECHHLPGDLTGDAARMSAAPSDLR